MANFNDLDYFDNERYYNDDEDPLENEEKEEVEENNNHEDNYYLVDLEDSSEETDLLTEYLMSKGINPESVKMENEYGDTEEVNFNDLSRDELLLLLNYDPAPRNYQEDLTDLTDDEEQLLQILRNNNMSVKDYLNSYRRHVIELYLANLPEPEPLYEIDDYSDEELFIADLKDKVPDLTEEEALEALEREAQNPELFQKKVYGLRALYQEKEQLMRDYETRQALAQQAQQAAQFELIIVDTIQNNNSIDLGDTSLELSEDDMNEIASFILDSDQAGVRHIAKALNDPRMLMEMAWWALKGHDALNLVTQYYRKQIAEARRSSLPQRLKPTNVVSKSTTRRSKVNSSDRDLFDDVV